MRRRTRSTGRSWRPSGRELAEAEAAKAAQAEEIAAAQAQTEAKEKELQALPGELAAAHKEAEERKLEISLLEEELEKAKQRLADTEARLKESEEKLGQGWAAAAAYEKVKDRTAGIELEAHCRRPGGSGGGGGAHPQDTGRGGAVAEPGTGELRPPAR